MDSKGSSHSGHGPSFGQGPGQGLTITGVPLNGAQDDRYSGMAEISSL
jgi:hypothetical protein